MRGGPPFGPGARGFSRAAPPWWPEGEAWPPRGPDWRRRRARFVRRAGLLFGVVMILAFIGAGTLVRWSFGGPGPSSPDPWRPVVLVIGVMIPIVLILAVRRVGSTIGDVVSAAHRVADGDFAVRVPVHGPPSVRTVANAFNNMTERLARQEQQRRALMTDIAHELRTPLSVVQGRLEGLIDGVYPRDASQLEPLLDETRVLARLVEDLRTLANAESGVLTLEREPTDIGMLVRDAAASLHEEAARRAVDVSIREPPGAAAVNVDPVRMRQVVVNLLANAIRHGGAGSHVAVESSLADGALTIRVADDGPGMPPEDLARIFDRFYKGPGSAGSGLGLTIARSLVRAHNGEISAESRVGRGTAITVRVPNAA